MDNINKRICALDKIIGVQVNTSANTVRYNMPNQLQSSQLGMTVTPEKMNSDYSNISYYGLDFLKIVLKDICQKKHFETNFDVEFDNINTILNSSDFTLSAVEKAYADLIYDISDDYPTFKSDKLEQAFELKQRQVAILSKTFNELTNYLNENGIDESCTYSDSIATSYYEDSYLTTFTVNDSYNVCLNSIQKATELAYGSSLENDVEISSSTNRRI